jgi:hypothetical protein
MYDYPEQIQAFIKEHFSPTGQEETCLKMTSSDLLIFLFQVFPEGCISDYELHNILVYLGFTRTVFKNELMQENFPPHQISTAWVIYTQLDLIKKDTPA